VPGGGSASNMVKRELNVRPAWEIGRNNPAAMALHPDDDPIIPEDEVNPPIRDTLAWLRKIYYR
jgi:hypothetical protein